MPTPEKESKQGKRGPDKRPRTRQKGPLTVRVQLFLTPENAEFLRAQPGTNSGLVNLLLNLRRNDGNWPVKEASGRASQWLDDNPNHKPEEYEEVVRIICKDLGISINQGFFC